MKEPEIASVRAVDVNEGERLVLAIEDILHDVGPQPQES